MKFLDKLVERAQSFLGVERPPVETQVVEADRFDHAYYQDVRHNVPALNTLIVDLSRKNDHVEPFMEDLFQAAYKADPHLRDASEMKPSHMPNHTMVRELEQTQQFQSLRSNTRGDEYGATMAVLAMETAIRESQATMAEARKAAEEAEKQQQEAQEAADGLAGLMAGMPGLDPDAEGPGTDPNGAPSPGQQALQDALDAAEAAAQQAANARSQAQQAAQQAANGMKANFKAAAQQASDDMDAEKALMSAFGVEDGDLQKMPFEERRQLAQKLRNNRMAKFAKLIGQFKMVQQAESRRKVQHAADEVVGVKLGNDLQRLIPAEMLNIATPELEDDFWMRYANHELLEYDLRGKEKLGQGPVIVVCDESGSMSGGYNMGGGSPEAWSKALALALCDQARQKNRDFHYIGFSSSRQQYTQTFTGGKTNIVGVIEMTEHFFGGGTAYEEPLRLALDLIDKAAENNKPKPDVVFITDDEYGTMNEDFMSDWNRSKDRADVRCFGIALGCGASGALEQVADNVRSLTDMTDTDPRVMSDLFRTI